MFPKFRDMSELKAFAKDHGNHFFDKDVLKFFSSRVSEELYGGRFFVTSEKNFDGTERRYSVRVMQLHEDSVTHDSIGGFQRFASHSGAHAAAKRYAKLVQIAEAYSGPASVAIQQIIAKEYEDACYK